MFYFSSDIGDFLGFRAANSAVRHLLPSQHPRVKYFAGQTTAAQWGNVLNILINQHAFSKQVIAIV